MAGKTILHVDDDQETLDVVRLILEQEGYVVDSVSSGKAALKKMKHNTYNLFLLDIMMPEISGWELFSKIQEIQPGSYAVFLTVLEVGEDKIKSMEKQGICDYIVKPFDRQDLVKRIKKILK